MTFGVRSGWPAGCRLVAATLPAKAASLQAVSGWGIERAPSDVAHATFTCRHKVTGQSADRPGPLLRGHCFGRVWSGADGRHRQGCRPVWLHHGRPQQWTMLGHSCPTRRASATAAVIATSSATRSHAVRRTRNSIARPPDTRRRHDDGAMMRLYLHASGRVGIRRYAGCLSWWQRDGQRGGYNACAGVGSCTRRGRIRRSSTWTTARPRQLFDGYMEMTIEDELHRGRQGYDVGLRTNPMRPRPGPTLGL